jgi:cyclic pyranopterin phosphate synthase
MAGRARLSHLDAAGRARMVDVGDKAVTARVAVAGAVVVMRPATLRMIARGALPKGDVLAVARLAGIMAAKRTAELIPLCHPLQLSHVDVQLTPRATAGRVDIEASIRLEGRTGADMEALTAASVAALTL